MKQGVILLFKHSLFYIIYLFFYLYSLNVYGQKNELNVAENHYERFESELAIKWYATALEKTKDEVAKAEIEVRIGNCYRRLLNEYLAYEHYKSAYKLNKNNKEALVMLAITSKNTGEYSQAIELFEKCKGIDNALAKKEIEACKLSLKWKTETPSYSIKSDPMLSTSKMDYAPTLINDFSMILTSDRDAQIAFRTNIYYSHKIGDKWYNPIPLDTILNKTANMGAISFDNKFNRMFFTMCPIVKGEFRFCGLYYTFLKGGMIGEPLPLYPDTLGGMHFSYGMPSYSTSMDILFFTSNRTGGYGKKDIWFTKYDEKTDSWGEPQNAGPEVNSSGDELFPFIASDSTLYFSSNEHLGVGGLDIFQANYKDGVTWSNVENLKFPINSEADDFGVNFTTDGKTGFFASNRKGGFGKDDIYSFAAIESINGETNDLKTPVDTSNETLEALYKAFNRDECEKSKENININVVKLFPNPNNGDFTVEFNCNTKTELLIRIFSSLGQVVHSENIMTSENAEVKYFTLRNIRNGIYYLQFIKNCEPVSTTKIVIEK